MVSQPSQIWQSDITYISVENRFYYAVFIIDVFSKEIVGYQVSDHMRAEANVNALKQALSSHKAPLIHHSDRGSQYTYLEYVSLLKQHNCAVSMGLTAQDNAFAERINRTIKEEYLAYWKPKSFSELKYQVKRAVENYNSKRIHMGIKRNTPNDIKHLYDQNKVDASLNLTIFNNETI